MAIYEHTNETETEWGKGKYQAVIMSPSSDKPVGYCDGTTEDEQALLQMAEGEGVPGVYIDKKGMKTGREIWTVKGEYVQDDFDID